MKWQQIYDLALNEAMKSPLEKKHSALLVYNGKIIATGYNNYKKGYIKGYIKQRVL